MPLYPPDEAHYLAVMMNLTFPTGLSQIAGQYDAILCDVWGVIHNGRRAFEEACAALTAFRAEGKPVCLITNAPVPKAHVIRHFEPLGVPLEAFDDCVSSGDATRAELIKREGQPAWLMGADRGFQGDRALWAGLDIDFTSPEAAAYILCMGLDDNANDDPEDYRSRLRIGIDNGLPMLCANPDIKVRVGDRLIWCAGALAEIYAEMGGKVIYPGKPHAPIYDLACARIGAPDASVTLCIGDSPATDMRGAAEQGMAGLYVGTGLKIHGDDFETEVRDLLSSYGARATYAMPALKW